MPRLPEEAITAMRLLARSLLAEAELHLAVALRQRLRHALLSTEEEG